MPLQSKIRSGLVRIACAAALSAFVVAPAVAQSQRILPRAHFGTSDLTKLRWLEGRWVGTGPGEPPFYEAYHFANDSTLEISYYNDAAFSRVTGTGRVYLSVGRIYHTAGAGQWGATKLDEKGVYFIPERNATNTFNWTYESPDAWTAVLRSSATGTERVRIYSMKRVP